MILNDLLLDDILPVTHLVLTLLFFNALEDLHDCQKVHEAHDKKDHEDDDEQEGPDVLHGLVSLGVGGEEVHDPGPETEDEHDVEGEPGEEEKGPGPEDTNHEEAITDQLAGETRQDEVERTRTSMRQMLLIYYCGVSVRSHLARS